MNTLTETGMTAAAARGDRGAARLRGGPDRARHRRARANCREPRCGELIDRGPLFADEAKEAKLVDRLGYRDEAIARGARRAGSGAELLSIVALSRRRRPAASTEGPTIALIYGAGLIVRERRRRQPADSAPTR